MVERGKRKMDLRASDGHVLQDRNGHQLNTQTFRIAKDQQFTGMINSPYLWTPMVDPLNSSLSIRSCDTPCLIPRGNDFQSDQRTSFNVLIEPDSCLLSTMNPSSWPESTVLCTRNSKGASVSQVQNTEPNAQLSKDVTLPMDCGSKSRSLMRNQKENEIHQTGVPSNEVETHTGADTPGNSSSYDPCAKRRRSTNQNSQLPIETKEDSETKEEAEHSGPKNTGKNADGDRSEPSKGDYIHVRAQRGQATNSHSLAPRACAWMQPGHWEGSSAGCDHKLCSVAAATGRASLHEAR